MVLLKILQCTQHYDDISEFKKGEILGARVAGAFLTKTASFCDVSRAKVSKVMSAYHQEG
ncbi:MAG: hypothetical protein GY820_06455 [Gammaproteobacteria bacterium]|nr:hypothetical protein [Gammaproteobacteria bacterium]